ncbi:MAG: alpha/beta hydrolase [Geminicoccaceae bacterium]
MPDPMTFHRSFSDEELEKQYNLRAGRPDYEVTVIPDWMTRSEQARRQLSGRLDIRYGEGERQTLDLFTCADPKAPLLVYFHGGYWQRGDKSIYSFLAVPFTERCVNVAVIGYDLCPSVTITRISEEAREALAYLWRNAVDLGINRERITVMGHSAGGHITEMMMGTDWPTFGTDLPGTMIQSGIPVSPLSLLEPVRLTSLNDNVRMDAAEAAAESPMLNHPPVTDAPQLLVVGGHETTEFHRQAGMYQDAFATVKRNIDLYVVPDVDHFDELNILANPDSDFFKKTMAMLDI